MCADDGNAKALRPPLCAADVQDEVDRVLEVTHGRYQWAGMAALGLANAADNAELMVISFIMPELPFPDSLIGVLSGSMFVGMIFGGLVSGALSDRHGRKRVLLSFMSINLVFGLLVVAMPDVWQWIFACRILAGVGVGGTIPVMFSMAAESVCRKHRSFFISAVCTYWLVGGLFVAGVCWYLLGSLRTSWTYAAALSQCPNLLAMSLVAGFLYETPNFYVAKGDYGRALDIAHAIAQFNKHSPVDCSAAKPHGAEGETDPLTRGAGGGGAVADYTTTKSPAAAEDTAAHDDDGIAAGFPLLFTAYRYPTILLFLQWGMLSFGWYGIVLWIPKLFESYGATYGVYQQSFLVQCSNVPGLLLCSFLITRMSSLLLLSVSMLLSCVVCTIMGFQHDLTAIVVLACCYNAVSIIGWNCLSDASAGTYPTHLRSTALGFLSAVGKGFSGIAEVSFGVMFDHHLPASAILFTGAGTMIIGAVAGLLLHLHRGKSAAHATDIEGTV